MATTMRIRFGTVSVRHCEPSHSPASTATLHADGTRVRLRSFSTMPGSTATTRSMSASVLAAPEAETNRVLRAMRGQSHRLQHVRRLERSRRACRAGGYRDAFEVERDQQRLGFDAIEADVRRVRHARLGDAVDAPCPVTARRMPASSRSRSAASRAPSSAIFARAIARGHAHADDAGHVLGAGAAAALLLAAGQQRQQAQPAPDPQAPTPFGP